MFQRGDVPTQKLWLTSIPILVTIVLLFFSVFVVDTKPHFALFTRGGMESMYEVVALALFSLALGGIMDYTGMLHSIVLALSGIVKTVGNLTATVLGASIFVNLFGANQYLAVILPGQMFEECYRAPA